MIVEFQYKFIKIQLATPPNDFHNLIDHCIIPKLNKFNTN